MQQDPSALDKSGIPYHPAGLRGLTDEQLNEAIRASQHTLGGGDLLQEVYRRDATKREGMIVRLTWAIAAMTLVVAIATTVLLVREPAVADPSAGSSYREQMELYVANVLLFVAADARFGSCLAEHGYSRGGTGQTVFLLCGSGTG